MGKKNPLSAFTDEEIFREAGRRMRAKAVNPPRAKVLRPCPKCGDKFGFRELRVHKPQCKGSKAIPNGRNTKEKLS
jgi:hypothetical protein